MTVDTVRLPGLPRQPMLILYNRLTHIQLMLMLLLP